MIHYNFLKENCTPICKLKSGATNALNNGLVNGQDVRTKVKLKRRTRQKRQNGSMNALENGLVNGQAKVRIK